MDDHISWSEIGSHLVAIVPITALCLQQMRVIDTMRHPAKKKSENQYEQFHGPKFYSRQTLPHERDRRDNSQLLIHNPRSHPPTLKPRIRPYHTCSHPSTFNILCVCIFILRHVLHSPWRVNWRSCFFEIIPKDCWIRECTCGRQ
jgi:hypothetical protein